MYFLPHKFSSFGCTSEKDWCLVIFLFFLSLWFLLIFITLYQYSSLENIDSIATGLGEILLILLCHLIFLFTYFDNFFSGVLSTTGYFPWLLK